MKFGLYMYSGFIFLAASLCMAAEPLRLTDANGEIVLLPKTPDRIVIAGRGSFMILHTAALFPSAAERVIAVSGGRQLKREQIELFTRSGHLSQRLRVLPGEVGPEQLAPLRPDLVILKRGATRLRDTLSRIGIPTLMVDLETPDTFGRDLRNFGLLLGDSARANALIAFYQHARAIVADRVHDLEEELRPRVLLVRSIARGGATAYSVPGADWMQTAMVELAGGRPIWKTMAERNNWSVIGLEQIAAWNPDVVFVVDFTDPDQSVADLRANPSWQLLPAVRNHRVYAVPSDGATWDQSDPRWILGLTWMARRLHPTLFNDLNLRAKLTEFYAWYGLSPEDVRTIIEPQIQGDWP